MSEAATTETDTEIDPDDLRDRIERLYMATTLEDEPRGALAWFARRVNVTTKTVRRWCSGTYAPKGPAVAALRLLEERAGVEPDEEVGSDEGVE